MKYTKTKFWQFVKYIIKKNYGYCKTRDGNTFRSPWRCAGCDAADVCDWIDEHIKLMKL